MSQAERTGVRDLTYSRWHRVDSIGALVGYGPAHRLGMIDVDCVEYCRRCNQPLALVETARDVGQARKATVVLACLAQAAGVPAYTLLYRVDDDRIVSFRAQRADVPSDWVEFTPVEWACVLVSMRDAHLCPKRARAAA